MTHHHIIKHRNIPMKPVESEGISAIGYDATSRILRVQFKKGLYDYHDVPGAVHEALMRADSHGSHLRKAVLGKYRFTKISE